MDIKYAKYDDKQIHETTSATAVAVRVAFLRIHLHIQHRQGAAEANWETINAHLEKLRKKSSNYQAA